MINIFQPQRDEVAGEWRRLHYEKLYALCSSQNIIRVTKKTELSRSCSTYGRDRYVRGFGGET